MKILLKGYTRKNLGDDLFFKIIADRYPEHDFYLVYNRLNNKGLRKCGNLHLIKSKPFDIILKSLGKNYKYEKTIEDKMDLIVQIGGSLFIQFDDNYTIDDFKKDYYVLGCNFGPYKNQKFYNDFYGYFSKAKDVTFREIASYNNFKTLENVRYAPDIIFSLNTEYIVKSSNKTVVFSVIEVESRYGKHKKNEYENCIINLIKRFRNEGYNIVMMSFCKLEGDETAINEILSKLEFKDNVSTYFYRGDINTALSVLAKSEIIVGSRFHANILGLVLNKKIIPIAYNDKIINSLNDINYEGKILDIRENNIDDCISQLNFEYVHNLCDEKEKANLHFQKLDLMLKGR